MCSLVSDFKQRMQNKGEIKGLLPARSVNLKPFTSLEEERANLSAFRTFVRFALVWFCLFPLPLGVWEGLRFVILALPGLFSYPFFSGTLKP